MNNNLVSTIIGLCCTIIGALLVASVIDIVKKKVEEVTIKVDSLKLWMLDQIVMIQGDYKAILKQDGLSITVLKALSESSGIHGLSLTAIENDLNSLKEDLKRYGDILDSVSKENNMLVAEVRSWATPTGCDGDACDINFEEDGKDE